MCSGLDILRVSQKPKKTLISTEKLVPNTYAPGSASPLTIAEPSAVSSCALRSWQKTRGVARRDKYTDTS